MSMAIRKVAVLGAGVMGSGIAAHLANAGIPCLLLDIVPMKSEEGEDTSSRAFRDKYAAGALPKLLKQKPAPLTTKKGLRLLEVGNFDDDMGRLKECDWVIEVVMEDMAIKQSLFEKVEANIGPNTIVSSNTSGLSIKGMLEGRSENFKQHFLVTHFFNPVRYMKLLELVAAEETLDEVVETIHQFGEERLGKGIVYGKDTTNFIANRIGVYGIMVTMQKMREMGLAVEEVDKILGPAMGRPKSAVFRTADLVGIDTLMHVAKNCYDSLVEDEERDIFAAPDYINKMVAAGMLGQKAGKGFYKKGKDEKGGRVILSLDLDTHEYVTQKKVRFRSIGAARKIEDVAKRIAKLLAGKDKAAEFAEATTLATLAYTSRRIPEIADDIVNIDRGLRWGFGWDLGPFEIWDAIGVEKGLERMEALGYEPAPWVKEMVAAGRKSFYAVEDKLDTYWDLGEKCAKPVPLNKRSSSVEILKRGNKALASNESASVWDMGDGVALLEFHSKMNSIDDKTIAMMNKSLDIAEKDFKGLVIGNDAQNFSVGANIMGILWFANIGHWDKIREIVVDFQNANQRMRYSPVPVVVAPAGLVLGGGCEVTLGGNAVQAAAESYIGLVEVGVGLIPGGGGNLGLLRNLYLPFAEDPDFDPFPFIRKAFMSIGMGAVATSAEEAREAGFIRQSDGISLNREFLLSDAKQRALGMADSFMPPRKVKYQLPGRSGMATFEMVLHDMQVNGHISEHDKLIGTKLASVLTGGDISPLDKVTEEHLLEIEQEAFLSLCGEKKTKQRLEHMLKTGKPLRN